MKTWHLILAGFLFVVAWYLYDKFDSVAFAYVDGKLFPTNKQA